MSRTWLFMLRCRFFLRNLKERSVESASQRTVDPKGSAAAESGRPAISGSNLFRPSLPGTPTT